MAMKNFTDMMMSILPQKDASIEKPWHGCHYQSRIGRERMIEAIKTALAIIGGLTVASAVAMAIIIFKR